MNKARLRGLARLTFGNPASLAYLALVAAVTLLVAFDLLFVTHEDASFSGVLVIFMAVPTIFGFFIAQDALWGLETAPEWFFYFAMVASVLLQSLALGLLLRLLSGRARPAHPQGV
ncbi:hypothetical protein [Streptomyces sp. NPDC051219]|uniref:SCO4225 family membrane protein n=1 Tax=Streptomyces sp. NPDC051219 TaxID=3155283 RepID=UPI003437331C